MKIHNLLLNNNILLAPMAGISDLPYRLIMKPFGVGLVYTEMVSAVGLVRGGNRNKTRDLLISDAKERPLAIQLFGADPEILATAARSIAAEADVIDINMGCPVPKVVKSGAGSALLKDPKLIGRIVAGIRKEWDGPLTIKIRSGWDAASINYLEVGRIIQEEGGDAVTLHPRTRSQGFSGHSDWAHIRLLKGALSIPVIGSGDIFTAQDGLRMLDETGCDALMIGRGGYGNPWLVAELQARLSGSVWSPPTIAARGGVAREHLQLCREIFGERKTLCDMRKHLCWYGRGVANAAGFRQAVHRSESIDDMFRLIDTFFVEETS